MRIKCENKRVHVEVKIKEISKHSTVCYDLQGYDFQLTQWRNWLARRTLKQYIHSLWLLMA